MKPSILAIRSIASEFAFRIYWPVLIILAVIAAVLVGLMVWLIVMSTWWLLLAIPVFIIILAGAVALFVGFVVLKVIAPDQTKQQKKLVKGFVLLTPFIALSASILCFVRGGLAVSPYKKYLQATTPEQRRQIQKESWKKQGPPTVLIAIVTAIIYLGFLAMVIVFVINYATIGATINGTGTFVALTLMIGLLAGFFTELLVRAIRARA